MSEHVVVKRDLLCRILKHWSKRPDGDETDVEISFILAQPLPEMVPMSAAKSLLSALTTIANIRSGDHGGYVASTTATAAIKSFNAKFKV